MEIHQQLQTGKLFCHCPSELEEDVTGTFVRRLRATKSEMGEVDAAALAETGKGHLFRYQMTPNTSCLVDADEEPPHPMNPFALEVALTVAKLTGMGVAHEIQVMRKIVINGSNTTGFQRTALVATGGAVPMPDGSSVPLQTLCLEEDSAREIEEGGGEVLYRLDRLGIPLCEIATAPTIHSGEQARDVAARIGALLRATKRVKRGLGTIRQDINISVEGGARVELKGVQDLRGIPLAVDEEAARQDRLLRAGELLARRGVTPETLPPHPHDVSDLIEPVNSKILAPAIEAGGRLWALKLPGFAGTIGDSLSLAKGRRVLGPEFSQRARLFGLGGIMHSEETDFGKYGLDEARVKELRARLGVGEHDAFVAAAGPPAALENVFRSVAERARLALRGVVSEVRAVKQDGTSVYLRPIPGAARMYPETDLAPILVTEDRLRAVALHLPPLPELRLERLVKRTGIDPALAEQLSQTDDLDLFEEVAGVEDEVSPSQTYLLSTTNTALARLLLTEVPAILKQAPGEGRVLVEHLTSIRNEVLNGRLDKGFVGAIFRKIARENIALAEAIAEIQVLGEDVARQTIRKVVEGRRDLVKAKGEAALGPLMGLVMKELKGKLPGDKAAAILMAEIRRAMGN